MGSEPKVVCFVSAFIRITIVKAVRFGNIVIGRGDTLPDERNFEILMCRCLWKHLLLTTSPKAMNDNEIKVKIQAVLEHCRKLTLQLARLSSDRKQVEGVASGFFIRVGDAIYLVSAGHALEKNGWVIETTFTVENECVTACIPIGGPWTLKKMTTGSSKLEKVDIAWAKVNLEAFQKSVSENNKLKGKSFEYLVYEGSLENTPDAKDPHIYAAANRATLFSALGKTYLERDFSYECEMEYKGTRADGLHVFSIPKHKGHDYYWGASGSPIIEPSGIVVAILVKGCQAKNELYGYPAKGLVDLIKIGSDVEQSGGTGGNTPK